MPVYTRACFAKNSGQLLLIVPNSNSNRARQLCSNVEVSESWRKSAAHGDGGAQTKRSERLAPSAKCHGRRGFCAPRPLGWEPNGVSVMLCRQEVATSLETFQSQSARGCVSSSR